MNLQVAVLLGQDGVTSGAIYGLLALAIVLVFSVTRVLFIPQGEFVAFSALTMASVQAGQRPGVVWLLAGLCAVAVTVDLVRRWRSSGASRTQRRASLVSWRWGVLAKIAYPALLVLLVYRLPLATMAMPLQIALTLALLVPLGPLLYGLVFEPIAEAPSLVLLIVAIALHIALLGVGLLAFGPEGARAAPFSARLFALGPVRLQSQTLWVIGAALALIALLWRALARSLTGKALRATATNRLGARLMGISPSFAGRVSFALAAAIGVISGVLIGPMTTLYYDSGFLISLKGFVGAIIGGLASYPLAAAGALLVGLLEAYSAFWASEYKDVIVFTLIIPVLLWRSITSHGVQAEEEEDGERA